MLETIQVLIHIVFKKMHGSNETAKNITLQRFFMQIIISIYGIFSVADADHDDTLFHEGFLFRFCDSLIPRLSCTHMSLGTWLVLWISVELNLAILVCASFVDSFKHS